MTRCESKGQTEKATIEENSILDSEGRKRAFSFFPFLHESETKLAHVLHGADVKPHYRSLRATLYSHKGNTTVFFLTMAEGEKGTFLEREYTTSVVDSCKNRTNDKHWKTEEKKRST